MNTRSAPVVFCEVLLNFRHRNVLYVTFSTGCPIWTPLEDAFALGNEFICYTVSIPKKLYRTAYHYVAEVLLSLNLVQDSTFTYYQQDTFKSQSNSSTIKNFSVILNFKPLIIRDTRRQSYVLDYSSLFSCFIRPSHVHDRTQSKGGRDVR